MAKCESETVAKVLCPGEVAVYKVVNPTQKDLERLDRLRSELASFCDGNCTKTRLTRALGKIGLLAGTRRCVMRFDGGLRGTEKIGELLGNQDDIEIYR